MRSAAFCLALVFVIVGGFVIDGPEEREDVLLLAALNILDKSSCYCFFPRGVMPQFSSFFAQVVVDGKVGPRKRSDTIILRMGER
jgi:hypothetical protein